MSYEKVVKKKKKKKKRRRINLKPLGKLKLSGGRRPLVLSEVEDGIVSSRSTMNDFKNLKSQRLSPPPSPLSRFYPASPVKMQGMTKRMFNEPPRKTHPPTKPIKPVDMVWMKDVRVSLSGEITNILILGDTMCVGLRSGIAIWNWRKRECKKFIKRPGRCFCLSFLPKFWLIFLEYTLGVFLIDIESYKIRAVLEIQIPHYPVFPHYHVTIRVRKTTSDSEKKTPELPDMFLSVNPENGGIEIFVIPSSPLFIPSKPKVNVPGMEDCGKLLLLKKYATMESSFGGDIRYLLFLPSSFLLVAVVRMSKDSTTTTTTTTSDNSSEDGKIRPTKNIIVIWDGADEFKLKDSIESKLKITKMRYFYNPRRKMEDIVTFSETGMCTIWNLRDRSIERHVQIIRDTVSLPYMRNSYIMTCTSPKNINFYLHLLTEKRGRKRKHHLQIWEFIHEKYILEKKPKYQQIQQQQQQQEEEEEEGEKEELFAKKVIQRRGVKRWGKKKTDNLATRHTDIFWLDEEKWLMGVVFEKRLSIFKLVDRRLSSTDLLQKKEREVSAKEDLFVLQQNRPKYEQKKYHSSSSSSNIFYHLDGSYNSTTTTTTTTTDQSSFFFSDQQSVTDIFTRNRGYSEESTDGSSFGSHGSEEESAAGAGLFDSFVNINSPNNNNRRRKKRITKKKKRKKKSKVKMKVSEFEKKKGNTNKKKKKKKKKKIYFTKEDEVFRVQFIHRHLNDILVYKWLIRQ